MPSPPASVRFVVAACLATGLGQLAHADDRFDQRGKHEHGKPTLNMALSNGLLSVDLDIAAVNLLGFEHAPRSVAEREKLATAVAWLKSARNVLGVPTNAGCRLQSSEVATPQFAPGEDHVDVEARWTFRCTNATALYWFEPWLLRRLLAIELLEINIVTDQLQTQEQVRQPTQRVVLR